MFIREISSVGTEGVLGVSNLSPATGGTSEMCGCSVTATYQTLDSQSLCLNGESQRPLNHILLCNIWSKET